MVAADNDRLEELRRQIERIRNQLPAPILPRPQLDPAEIVARSERLLAESSHFRGRADELKRMEQRRQLYVVLAIIGVCAVIGALTTFFGGGSSS